MCRCVSPFTQMSLTPKSSFHSIFPIIIRQSLSLTDDTISHFLISISLFSKFSFSRHFICFSKIFILKVFFRDGTFCSFLTPHLTLFFQSLFWTPLIYSCYFVSLNSDWMFRIPTSYEGGLRFKNMTQRPAILTEVICHSRQVLG